MSDNQDESGSPRTRIKLGAVFDSLVDAEGPKGSVIIGPLAAALGLDAIEARANALPAGPWTVEEDGCVNGYIAIFDADGEPVLAEMDHVCAYDEDTDENVYEDRPLADFIAAARDDIPALVARVRELEEAARDVVSGCADTANARALDALAALVGGDR